MHNTTQLNLDCPCYGHSVIVSLHRHNHLLLVSLGVAKIIIFIFATVTHCPFLYLWLKGMWTQHLQCVQQPSQSRCAHADETGSAEQVLTHKNSETVLHPVMTSSAEQVLTHKNSGTVLHPVMTSSAEQMLTHKSSETVLHPVMTRNPAWSTDLRSSAQASWPRPIVS